LVGSSALATRPVVLVFLGSKDIQIRK